MRIEIDKSAILSKKSDEIMTDETLRKEKKPVFKSDERIFGMRRKNEIFLSPSQPIYLITSYLHEVGHIIGNNLPFLAERNKPENTNALSFDEVKNPKTKISLSLSEIIFLLKSIHSKKNIKISKEIQSIANKLLICFTSGTFNPSTIKVHSVSQDELEKLVFEGNQNTITKTSDGKLYFLNSKIGRNDEIPAYITQFCCMQIFENTLHHYKLLNSKKMLEFKKISSPSHQRAINLVGRAFVGEGWRLPFKLDEKSQ